MDLGVRDQKLCMFKVEAKNCPVWKMIFKDCFGKIMLNPIFEHERLRIRKRFLHNKCLFSCSLFACKISDSLEHSKNGFMLRKFCLAIKAS